MLTEKITAVLGHHLASFSAGDVEVTTEGYYRGEHALHARRLPKRPRSYPRNFRNLHIQPLRSPAPWTASSFCNTTPRR